MFGFVSLANVLWCEGEHTLPYTHYALHYFFVKKGEDERMNQGFCCLN